MAEQGINITGSIGNKQKRQEIYAAYKKEKAKRKRAKNDAAKKLEEELGANAPPKQVPRTLDNTREVDDTVVGGDDAEVQLDEQADAFEQCVRPLPRFSSPMLRGLDFFLSLRFLL